MKLNVFFFIDIFYSFNTVLGRGDASFIDIFYSFNTVLGRGDASFIDIFTALIPYSFGGGFFIYILLLL